MSAPAQFSLAPRLRRLADAPVNVAGAIAGKVLGGGCFGPARNILGLATVYVLFYYAMSKFIRMKRVKQR